MTEFKKWRNSMGLTQAQAALALGLSKSAIEQYDSGMRKGSGDAVEIPRAVSLAMSWLAFHPGDC